MGASSPGRDDTRRMLTSLLWLLLMQLAVIVTAESDHKTRRKVAIFHRPFRAVN